MCSDKKNPVAFITGVTGQDGAYLCEYLLEQGYIVHGLKRRASSFNTQRIDHLYVDRHVENARLFLHYGDLTDSTNLIRIIQEIQPDEIYNLAAMSHVHISFETPEYTGNADALGTLRLLEAIRLLKLSNKTKFYQASTSELFGKVQEVPQRETTPFYPRSPYAVAKLYSYWTTINYREAYNIFACNGILFNHESPMRGENFVTRKITRAVASIAYNLENKLFLGNLNAERDWGHAKDYVRAMHLMLQLETPEDFVIATGKSHSVREFVRAAFECIGLTLNFTGVGVDEKGVIAAINADKFEKTTQYLGKHLKVGQVLVEVSAEYFRPTEVDALLGDPSKAKKILDWQPEYTLWQLIEEMVNADLQHFAKRRFYMDHLSLASDSQMLEEYS